jgi:hypothetical protein
MLKVKEHEPHGDEDSGHIGPVKCTEFVEWVDSPIRIHKVQELPKVDKNEAWVESPIRPHNNEQGLLKVKQNRQNHTPASSKCFREISGFGISMQEVPLLHSGSVRDSPLEAFMNFEANDTSMSPCDLSVPVLPPACMQQQNLTWFFVNFAASPGAALRYGPDLNAQCTGIVLLQNEVFPVDHEIASPDGGIFLRLADGRGWAFDDAALTLEDPSATSVIRMDFKPGSNAFISPYNASTLQHGEQPQFGPFTMESLNPHNLEPMYSSCVSCTCSIDANAKFCIICGEKQPSPLGIANPGGEVRFPHYQYEVQHTPWLEPYTHYC